jgi:hypothetical protein
MRVNYGGAELVNVYINKKYININQYCNDELMIFLEWHICQNKKNMSKTKL